MITPIDIFGFTFLYAMFSLLAYGIVMDFVENPLWLGLIVIFWPIAIVCGIPYGIVILFVNWIKSCIKYYRKKRNDSRRID